MFPAVLKAGAFQFHFALRKTGWKEQIQRGMEIERWKERENERERDSERER